MTSKNNMFLILTTVVFVFVFLISWIILVNKKPLNNGAVSQPVIIQLTSLSTPKSAQTAEPAAITPAQAPTVNQNSTSAASSYTQKANATEPKQQEDEDEDDD